MNNIYIFIFLILWYWVFLSCFLCPCFGFFVGYYYWALLLIVRRLTSLRQRRLSANQKSARSTLCTRLPSTRRVKIAWLLRERDVMIASSQVMVVRPSLFSTRRWMLSEYCFLSDTRTLLRKEINVRDSVEMVYYLQVKTPITLVVNSFCLLNSWPGKDNQKDCVEASMPGLQTCLPTRN